MKAIALAENTIGRQPLNGGNGDGFDERGASYTLNATGVHGVCVVLMDQGGGVMQVEKDITGTLRKETHGHEPVVAFTQNQAGDVLTGEVMHNLGTNSNATGRNAANVHAKMQVRRLTPTECERLQGFPDGHTAIQWKGKPAPDGLRYKALGNSMACNVMSWIGQRIQMCDEILKELNRKQ